jgi:predicted RNA-binding protein with TRAM domain
MGKARRFRTGRASRVKGNAMLTADETKGEAVGKAEEETADIPAGLTTAIAGPASPRDPADRRKAAWDAQPVTGASETLPHAASGAASHNPAAGDGQRPAWPEGDTPEACGVRSRTESQVPVGETLAHLAVTDLTLEGKGVARHNGQVAFVDGGLPGDIVAARVTGTRKRVLEAGLLRDCPKINGNQHRLLSI